MKKTLALSLIASILIGGCKDKDDPTPPAGSNFQPTTTNSTWTYKVENKINPASNFNYTVKATSKDTSINGKTYKVFSNSSGGNEYAVKSGTDYYQFAGFADLTNSIELNYLKDAALGTKWSETKPVTVSGLPLTPTFNYEITEIAPTMTVNGLNFTNVVKVRVTLTVPGLTFLSQTLNFYYADGVGRIKSQTKLSSAFPPIDADTETSITAYTIAP